MATFIERLGQAFVAAGGKKLSEGGTVEANIAALDIASSQIGSNITARPIGSLAGDILRTAAPGLALTAAGVIPALSASAPTTRLLSTATKIATQNGGKKMDAWDAIAGLGSQLITAFAPQDVITGAPPVFGNIFGEVPEQKQPQIDTGITRSSALPGRCNVKRRHLKIMVGDDGQPHVFAVCPPRRMNPLNAHALSRAARRLSRFQQIAKGIDAMINRQICRHTKARRPGRGLPRCSPRKGC